MYILQRTGTFKKDVKRCSKRGYNINDLIETIDLLAENGELSQN